MPNRLFAFETAQANLLLARLFAYDLGAAAWVTVHTGLPDLAVTGCWDGGELYMIGSRDNGGTNESRLYRYSFGSNTWLSCIGGASFTSSVISSIVADGNYVYILGGGKFWRYDKSVEQVAQIALPFTPGGELVWDYSSNIYIVSNTVCGRYSAITGMGTALTTPPTGSTALSAAYTNGFLYVWTQSDRYRLPIPGTVWESLGGAGENADRGQAQIDDRNCFTLTGGGGTGGFRLFDFVGGVSSSGIVSPLGGVAVIAPVFEIPIQSVFTFLEKDGVTPQLATEPLGGSNARYFSGVIAGPFLFTVKCASPRQAVQLAVVPDATVDIVANVEIAPAAGGPWSDTAQLGAFTAGQVKPYYIRFVVPEGSVPSLKQFALVATSL